MKTLPLILLLFATTTNTFSQYQINWSTSDGGGGQSSGRLYTLTGTIGQPDAGLSSGDNYTLQSGFWSAFAVVQTENAPSLRILLDGTNVTLAWPNPSTGFQLQESPSLTTPNWANVNDAPTIVGEEKQVSHAVAPVVRFYRLHQP